MKALPDSIHLITRWTAVVLTYRSRARPATRGMSTFITFAHVRWPGWRWSRRSPVIHQRL